MRFETFLLVGVAFTALSAGTASAQDAAAAEGSGGSDAVDSAQDTIPAGESAEDPIVVTGIRASLQSAQARKQNADQIVDSIVAEDIGKLPDVNVTEALQRISGVQVARDRGEGGSVAIRGLSQVLVTVNGREAVTVAAPGGGAGTRGFNLQDVPSELLAGIDIYKSPSANLIEGGIGGLIDLRTRRPLDLDRFFVSGSAIGRYSDLREKISPMLSGLVSTKWDVGGGEMGLLLSGAYQERDYRADVIGVGNPLQRRSDNLQPCGAANPCTAANVISLPNGTFEPLIVGERKRIGLDGMFQWKPSRDLEFYAQASYQRFKDSANQWGINKQLAHSGQAVPTSVTYFPGTQDVATANFQNLVVQTFSAARDVIDENQQYAVGGSYKSGPAKLSAEFAYQKSHNELYYTEADLRTTVPTAQFDITGDIPRFDLSGTDLSQLGNYRLGLAAYNENQVAGDHYQAKMDAEFDIESSFMTGFNVGLRWAQFKIDFLPTRFFNTSRNDAPTAGLGALFGPAEFRDRGFFNTDQLAANFLTPSNDLLRNDFDSFLTQAGITARPAIDQRGIYDITEETRAAYAMGEFRLEGPLPIDGNIGVRVVDTVVDVNGNQPVFGTDANGNVVQTGFAPITLPNNYLSVLPSANVRIGITEDLQLRLAAAKTLTRPNFGQLAPGLTLVPGQQNGSGGNPTLRPLRADQLDASLEYYLSRSSYVYAAGFYRKVKDFVLTTSTPGVQIGDIVYTITRPENLEKGNIKGFEVGGQTFFDFLPSPFDGFGVQANYTHVKSDTPSAVVGFRTPLPNLSKHSFNLIGLYEKGPFSARVAYNYRSKFLSGVFAGGLLGISPVYRKGYGWLDASLNYDITDQFSVTLEASNLLRTREETYYGVTTRPNNYSIDDRQFLFGVRFKM